MRRFSTMIAIALTTLLFASICSAQNVPNFSFEQVQIGPPFETFFQTDIPGWTHSGSTGDNLLWAIGAINGLVNIAGDGNQFVTLGGGVAGPATASWTTTVRGLRPGGNYILGFKVANEGQPYPPTQTMTAMVTVGNNILAMGTFTTTCGSGLEWWQCWEQENLAFTATRGYATLTFTVTNQMYDMGLDDVTVTRVPATGGTWAPTPPFPGSGAGSALLLTDGRVLVHSEQSNPSDWYTLTPDAYGNYDTKKATWTKVKSMTTLPTGYCYAPLAFASAVLPDADARVIVEGGEFNVPPPPCAPVINPAYTNKGAIYDPVLDTWSEVDPPATWTTIGDAQSVVLPGETFMLANSQTRQEAEMTAPYLGGSSWVATGTFKHTRNDEEGWTLLPGAPDAEVLLTVGTSFGCGANNNSEMYVNGSWYCIANTPTQLWDNTYHEMGPAVLRPDGTVFQAGGTIVPSGGQSAIFDTNTSLWTAGPNFPPDPQGNQLDIADGPAALLPNGNVLMMTNSPTNPKDGAFFFELQYGTIPAQLVQALTAPPNAKNDISMDGHMLVLPTGQIWFSDFSTDVEIYTPADTGYSNSWAPVIQDITAFGKTTPVASCFGHITTYPPPPCITISQSSTNMLDGYQLNGLSQGAAYGDDYQSATNYPLVRITEEQVFACLIGQNCPQPRVYYCRTHDHSNMGVATGDLLVSTSFDCPNVPIGFAGTLDVVANGIPGGFIPVIVK